MKQTFKKISAFMMALAISGSLFAQVPQKFNYQGIARDTKGNPMSQQRMTLKLTVLPTSDATEGEYEEIQTVTTNEFGLYTLQIGNGTPVNGEMKAVKWETGNKYIKVAIDPKGGNDFVDAGTNQLLSVPYAIYADKAGTAKNAGGGDRLGAVSTSASGTGTVNYLTKFTAANTIFNSQLFDNGTNIGIGTTSPAARLHLYSNVASVQQHLRMQNESSTGAGRFTMYNDGALSYATFSKYGLSYAGGYAGIPTLYPYANLLAFGNNGVAANDGLGRFLIMNGGNVGIGLFKGGTSRLKFHADYATGKVGIGGNAVPASQVHFNNTDDGNTGDTLKITNATTGHTINDGLEIRVSGNNARITNRENAYVILGTNNTDRLAVDGAGNVGIGTNTPTTKLDINGQIRMQGGTPGLGKVLTSDATGLATWQAPAATGITGSGTANYIPKFTPNGTALGNSVLFNNGNNVGIGTNAPTDHLHIKSPTGAQMRIHNSNSNISMYIAAPDPSTNTTGGIGTDSLDLPFFTGGVDRVTIKQDGKVGIATTLPDQILTLGDYTSASDRYLSIRTSGGNLYKSGIQFKHNADTIGWVLESDETSNSFRINHLNSFRSNKKQFKIDIFDHVFIGDSVMSTNDTATRIFIGHKHTSSILRMGENATNFFTIGWIKLSPDSSQSYASIQSQGGNSMVFQRDGGKLGIGIATPVYPVDIRGLNPDDGSIVQIGNSDESQFLRLFGGRQNDPNPFLMWKENSPLRFATNAGGYSEKMRIDTNGNVGIGTVNPTSKLHIYNGVGNQELLKMENNVSTGFGKVLLSNDIAANHASFTKYGNAFAGGISGISTQYTYANMLVMANNGGPLLIQNTGNVGIGTISGANTNLKININKASGYLGLGGNIEPAAKVHFNTSTDKDTIKFTNSATGHSASDGFEIRTTANNTRLINTENAYLVLGTNNTDRLAINGIGDVGIGTVTPSQKLTVYNGTTTGTYTTSGWIHSSDARLKTNIKPLEKSLDKILQLQGVSYNWNASPATNSQIGFIAQDVQKIFPEVVVVDQDGKYGMAYQNLVAPMVEAMKEQQHEIQLLKQQNEMLLKRLEALEKK